MVVTIVEVIRVYRVNMADHPQPIEGYAVPGWHWTRISEGFAHRDVNFEAINRLVRQLG